MTDQVSCMMVQSNGWTSYTSREVWGDEGWIGKLFDGSGKVTNGLNTPNSKTGEMQIGIGKLVDGLEK